MKKLLIKSNVRAGKAGGWDANHNGLRVKTNVKAGRRVDFTGALITEVKLPG